MSAMEQLTLEDVVLVLQWASSLIPASQHEESGALQTALRPSVLLELLAQTVPVVPGEPALTCSAALDDLGQLTVYCNACLRLGMRRLFKPSDLLEGSGLPAVVANLLELRAVHIARSNGRIVSCDYAAQSTDLPHGAHNALDPSLRMTYAEHAALYTGSLSLSVAASGRARLWQVRPSCC
jgi:hypothetical protein